MDPEIVTDKECKKCNNSMEAKLSKTLTRMPNILIVQLRRFSWDGRWQKKIHTPVKTPLYLNMGQYTNEDKAEYQLYSVINHEGGMTAGHYKAVCREAMNGNWVCFDDRDSDTWTEAEVESNRHVQICHTSVPI